MRHVLWNDVFNVDEHPVVETVIRTPATAENAVGDSDEHAVSNAVQVRICFPVSDLKK